MNYKNANRSNKRTISRQRSIVSEVKLDEPCLLLPNQKRRGVINEVDEFIAVNWFSKKPPRFLLVEQDESLAKDLKAAYEPERIPVFHSKLSAFVKQYAGKISYMHADYCATVNAEAEAVICNLKNKLAQDGSVLRFTHVRRNNYKMFHLKDSKNLIDWLVHHDAISRQAGDNLYIQSLRYQTDPTLRVGIQLIQTQVMGTNTLRDPTQIGIFRSNNYNIVDCVIDKYQDTGANMQTMRFVLKPCVDLDISHVISSLYVVYNALS